MQGWNSLDTVLAAEGLCLTLQSLGNLTEAKDLLERYINTLLNCCHVVDGHNFKWKHVIITSRCLEVRKTILPEDHNQVF